MTLPGQTKGPLHVAVPAVGQLSHQKEKDGSIRQPLAVIILFVIGHLSKKTYGLISGHRGGDKCLCEEAPLPTHKTRLPHSNRDYPHILFSTI